MSTTLQQAQAQAALKPPGSPAGGKAAEDKTVLATTLKAKEAEVSRLQQDLQKKSKQVKDLPGTGSNYIKISLSYVS
jgi:hypothetical protein